MHGQQNIKIIYLLCVCVCVGGGGGGEFNGDDIKYIHNLKVKF